MHDAVLTMGRGLGWVWVASAPGLIPTAAGMFALLYVAMSESNLAVLQGTSSFRQRSACSIDAATSPADEECKLPVLGTRSTLRRHSGHRSSSIDAYHCTGERSMCIGCKPSGHLIDRGSRRMSVHMVSGYHAVAL